MFALQKQSDSVSLIAELQRFAEAWLMGHATPSPSPHVATGSNLPLSLDRVLQLNERYNSELFCQQDSLLDRDSIRTDRDRLYFLDINQTGAVVFALLSDDQDPYVFHDGDTDTPIDRLSNFLVTYALQELMFYPPNEPWDFGLNDICQEFGHPLESLWIGRRYVYGDVRNYYFCNRQAITVTSESYDAYTGYFSLDDDLLHNVKRKYPAMRDDHLWPKS